MMTPQKGAISGAVTNSSGLAVAGATVQIRGGVVNFSMAKTTASGGTYSSGQVSVGTYTVSVSATGYQTQTQNATVTNGQTTAVNFVVQ